VFPKRSESSKRYQKVGEKEVAAPSLRSLTMNNRKTAVGDEQPPFWLPVALPNDVRVRVLAAILVCNAYCTLLINYITEIAQQESLWQIVSVLAVYRAVMIDPELPHARDIGVDHYGGNGG
jgi:hypothetical protein